MFLILVADVLASVDMLSSAPLLLSFISKVHEFNGLMVYLCTPLLSKVCKVSSRDYVYSIYAPFNLV